MELGPDLFARLPALRTRRLAGEPSYHADMFFTADERHLVVRTGGTLRVWDVPLGHPVRSYRNVNGVVEAEARGELLALVGGDDEPVRLVGLQTGGTGERVIAAELPLLDQTRIETVVYLSVWRETVVVATCDWVRCLDLATGVARGGFSFLSPSRRQEFDARLVRVGGVPYLRLMRFGHQRSAEGTFRRGLWSLDGAEVVGLSSRLPDLDWAAASLGDTDVAYAGLGRLGDSSALAVLDAGDDFGRALLLRPFRADMRLVPSRGEALAGTAPDLLAVWRGSELLGTFECDGNWYNPFLSPDGRRVVLAYTAGSPLQVAGVFDPEGGRAVGHCIGHLCGSASAFSRSGRYFASVTNGNACNPEAGLPNGTVVLTELEGD